jgi:hypothetical protein
MGPVFGFSLKTCEGNNFDFSSQHLIYQNGHGKRIKDLDLLFQGKKNYVRCEQTHPRKKGLKFEVKHS